LNNYYTRMLAPAADEWLLAHHTGIVIL